jgi:hypothetical protein
VIIKQEEMDRDYSTRRTRGMRTGFWRENQKATRKT